MKAYYENRQRFDVSSRFSVGQRRFAWELRRHPKLYRSGSQRWLLIRSQEVQELSEKALDDWQEAVKQSFIKAATAVHLVAAEKTRRAAAPEAR